MSKLLKKNECLSCGEEVLEKCLSSKKNCGHHCNHSWTHDYCCFCQLEFLEEEHD